MPKKDLDKPATQRQLVEITDTIKEVGSYLLQEIKTLKEEFTTELKEFRSEQKENWKKQRQFNKEISQKVDANTSAMTALDRRVRHQEDMPERLDYVENKTYELGRRMTALER
ncbi:MAG: hypothetical protein WEC84_00500 [Candidatus Andersenbacteria bacterium]